MTSTGPLGGAADDDCGVTGAEYDACDEDGDDPGGGGQTMVAEGELYGPDVVAGGADIVTGGGELPWTGGASSGAEVIGPELIGADPTGADETAPEVTGAAVIGRDDGPLAARATGGAVRV